MDGRVVQYVVFTIGAAFTLVGILGFIPGAVRPLPPGAPELVANAAYGLLFDLFPVNVLHDLVHLGLGVLGMTAASTYRFARGYAQWLALIYGALAVMGLLPILNTLFGFVPIFGHDVWLHAVTAVVSAYFGFAPERHTRATSAYKRRAA